MISTTLWVAPLSTTALILVAMGVVAVIEVAIPLHARGQWNRRHLRPNLALTLTTFATNVVLTAPLVVMLAWLESSGRGLFSMLALPELTATAFGFVMLDLAAYLAHTTMHRVGFLWRFHRVHHSDPAVDVTTAVRQHPGESLTRYAFMSAFAIGLGVSPATLALYRAWSALSALFEHANIRLPRRFDNFLSLVVVSPNMHKVHHSRTETLTNTNYGNIFSIFDRLFSTFTPAARGLDIVYGLDGFDDPATQTTSGLLALPLRAPAPRHAITDGQAGAPARASSASTHASIDLA